MLIQIPEARIILIIEAIRTSKKLSRRAAVKLYNIPESILRYRINETNSIAQRQPYI
jgi:hypothetical protein